MGSIAKVGDYAKRLDNLNKKKSVVNFATLLKKKGG
jgi:hypothetical protein